MKLPDSEILPIKYLSAVFKYTTNSYKFYWFLAIFEAFREEIFDLLGPNGAGKTTTLEMIEGLRKTDAGELYIAGYNVQNDS
ncbi:MAG: ATP-binding cassette domain-containing protein [Calditrichaeota bacterium]|nr:MAG: ATP-binding cassette domain-containing protein [Calditrichota bacterium]